MKGRNIQENLIRTLEVIQYAKEEKIPSIIVTIDFKKCFDLIEHSSIYATFKYFNFGDKFINWIRLFFTDLQLYTHNFGILSSSFKKGRGVNQGCNISPFCFLLCGELMTRKLKSNPKIQGIEINGITNLISQFADDTTLFLKYDQESLQSVIDTLSEIERHTGLVINYEKTQIFRAGSIHGTNQKLKTSKDFVWSNNDFEMLGIYMGNSVQNICKMNYERIIDKMSISMEIWKSRNATLLGKILITNVLFESLFVYKLMVLEDLTENQIRKIEELIDKFLWAGKKAKIAKATLQQSKQCGGQRLFNIRKKQAALKLQWIPKIQNKPFFRDCFLRGTGLPNFDMLFHCNLSHNDAKKVTKKQNFWGQLFIHWCEINHHTVQSEPENLLNEIIWFNSNILVNKAPQYHKECVAAGIVKLKDLFTMNKRRRLLTYDELVQKNPQCNLSWLYYNSLISAIPNRWKHCITTSYIENSKDTTPLIEDMISKPKVSGWIYQKMIRDNTNLVKYKNRWAEQNVHFDFEKYQRSFNNLYLITDIIKLRNFQYRLLLNKIPTNVDTTTWGITNDSKCTFCKKEEEDIFHLLFQCKFSKRIWDHVSKFCDIEINKETIILNTFYYKNNKHIFNLVGLILKQFLYRCRCQKKLPNISNFRTEIKQTFNIENIIARRNLKLSECETKWLPVILLLNN